MKRWGSVTLTKEQFERRFRVHEYGPGEPNQWDLVSPDFFVRGMEEEMELMCRSMQTFLAWQLRSVQEYELPCGHPYPLDTKFRKVWCLDCEKVWRGEDLRRIPNETL